MTVHIPSYEEIFEEFNIDGIPYKTRKFQCVGCDKYSDKELHDHFTMYPNDENEELPPRHGGQQHMLIDKEADIMFYCKESDSLGYCDCFPDIYNYHKRKQDMYDFNVEWDPTLIF